MIFSYFVQRRYIDKNNVATLVDEFYHLLRFAVDIGSQQSCKLTYAVVVMDNIITRFQLIELLYEHRCLASSGSIRPQGIFVQTIEYLMVGKKAYFQVVVHKTLVQTTFDSFECDIIASIIENTLYTVGLLAAVGRYKYTVSFSDIIAYILRY